MDALAKRFPQINLPKRDDICYATQNRQDAVKELAEHADLILVVGAPASSNSNRLVEVASRRGVPAHLIQNAQEIDPNWIDEIECVGVTAGASTPDVLVQGVIRRLKDLSKDGAILDSLPEVDEGVRFKLPRELRDA
jgi:4-hydroxy-3-methylbut-2-enyl diphosphate reductase